MRRPSHITTYFHRALNCGVNPAGSEGATK
jgi:hypothetical protein